VIVLFVTVCLVNDDMVLLVLLKVMIDLSGDDDDEILCGELVQIIIIISVRCSALRRTATERTGDVWGPP